MYEPPWPNRGQERRVAIKDPRIGDPLAESPMSHFLKPLDPISFSKRHWQSEAGSLSSTSRSTRVIRVPIGETYRNPSENGM